MTRAPGARHQEQLGRAHDLVVIVRAPMRKRPFRRYLNRGIDFTIVVQTPHTNGMATTAHARRTAALKPPAPPAALPAALVMDSCASRFSSNNSLSLMNHFPATGRTSRFAMKPTTNMPAKVKKIGP